MGWPRPMSVAGLKSKHAAPVVCLFLSTAKHGPACFDCSTNAVLQVEVRSAFAGTPVLSTVPTCQELLQSELAGIRYAIDSLHNDS